MHKTSAGNLLKSFVARGWLSKSKRGRYAMGPRAIVELGGWLFSEYPELMERCARCQKTVLSVRIPYDLGRGSLAV